MTDQEKVELLATKVMGWIPKTDYFVGDKRIDCFLTDEGKRIAAYQWNPLQNIVDAWMIVEKFRAMRDTNYEAYRAFYEHVPESIYAITPKAICNAALKVVGVNVG
jgi:hypothetical protein